MSLRTLHRKGIALALGSALSLGLAAPAFAAPAPASPGGGWPGLALQALWGWLGAGKAAAAPSEAARPAGTELERSSGIDPNGRKSGARAGSGAPGGPAAARPAHATFTCETIR